MSSTTVPGGNGAFASKYLLSVIHRDGRGKDGFANMLTDGIKSVLDSEEESAQSSEHAPIVTGKAPMGQDEIEMQVFHDLDGEPSVGNEPLKGREGTIGHAKFKMRINVTRKGVVDDMVSQIRNVQDLAMISERKLKEWAPRWQSEVAKYMLAGGRGMKKRGSLMGVDDGTNRLDVKTINGIQPPTFREKYYGGSLGNVGTVADLAANSTLTYDAVDRITNDIDNSDDPLSKVRYEGTDDIKGIWFMSILNWEGLKQENSRAFDKLMTDAKAQVKGWDHELFKQEMAMVNGYLLMKYPGPPIRWEAGDLIDLSEDNDTATVTSEPVPAGLFVERSFILGGQALGSMYGSMPGKFPLGLQYDVEDYGARKGVALVMYNAMKKIRLENEEGRLVDVGVRVVDSVVSR